MTKKRFTDVWCSETGHIGVTDNGIDKEFTGSKFGDFLNELSDENEQLKTIINQLRTDNTKQKKKLNTAMKENEQLKKEIEELKQALIHSAFDR